MNCKSLYYLFYWFFFGRCVCSFFVCVCVSRLCVSVFFFLFCLFFFYLFCFCLFYNKLTWLKVVSCTSLYYIFYFYRRYVCLLFCVCVCFVCVFVVFVWQFICFVRLFVCWKQAHLATALNVVCFFFSSPLTQYTFQGSICFGTMIKNVSLLSNYNDYI